jgi:hypothetical protein
MIFGSPSCGIRAGRAREWEGLDSFVARGQPTATLHVVSGRRRQGKSFLLEALARETGGLYLGGNVRAPGRVRRAGGCRGIADG